MEPPPGISNREVRKEHKYGKEIKLRMEKSGKKMNEDKSLVDKVVMGERLDLAEIICPICMCVLISPVQMPCQHVLCLPCFQETVTHSNTCCPICRTRLSTWCRKATRDKTLISLPLWGYIQETYPGEVSARQAGEDKTDPEEMFPCVPNHQFAMEGEIKSEFEAVMERERKEKEQRDQEEELRSRELILRLQEEEYKEERARTRQDEEFARKLMNTVSPGKENLGLQTRRRKGSIEHFLNLSHDKGAKNNIVQYHNATKASHFSSEDKNKEKLITTPSRPSSSSSSRTKMFSPTNIALFRKENNITEPFSKCETAVSGSLLANNKSGALQESRVSGSFLESGMSGSFLESGVSGSLLESGVSGSLLESGVSGSLLESGVSGSLLESGVSGSLLETSKSGALQETRVSGSFLESGVSSAFQECGVSDSPLESGVLGSLQESGVSGAFQESPNSGGFLETTVSGTPQDSSFQNLKLINIKKKNIFTNVKMRSATSSNALIDSVSNEGNELSDLLIESQESQSLLCLTVEADTASETRKKEKSQSSLGSQYNLETCCNKIRNSSVKNSLNCNLQVNEQSQPLLNSKPTKYDSFNSPDIILTKDKLHSEKLQFGEDTNEFMPNSKLRNERDMNENNAFSSADTQALLDLFSSDTEFDESLIEEQRRIEMRLEQERIDLDLAQKLQDQINKDSRSVDRRKGSEDEYRLRAVTPSSQSTKRRRASGASSSGSNRKSSDTGKKRRQMSLQESFKRTKLSFTQDSEEF